MPVNISALLNDVQTGVVRSVNAQVVAYLFFRITDPATFVKQLPDGKAPAPGLGITTATFCPEALRVAGKLPTPSASTPATSLALANIAFTYNGLVALGVDEKTLVTFPEPFREGMAHRAAFLGDLGKGAPECWEGHLGSRDIHGVVWASFQVSDPVTPSQISDLFTQLKTALGNIPIDGVTSPQTGGLISAGAIPGAEVMHVELGRANYKDDYTVEHFGFRDGISQPFVNIGLAAPTGGLEAKHGELLLGYPGEQGSSPQLLPSNKTLRDNGTYMVFRKLEQDVVAFRDFMKKYDPQKPDRLAAQMVGRWPSGSPLVLDPDGSAPSPEQAMNDFNYQQKDPKGLLCPIGAHIRRSNPRDTNERDDEAKRHRLFRRGISYGGELLPDGSAGDGKSRGLFFVSLQARIDRQFEFVQGRWLNGGEFAGQAGAHLDPLTGAHDSRMRDAFHPAGRPAPITGLPRFVTLRGGDYFFVPSFSALAAMRANDTFTPDPASPSSPVIELALGTQLPSKTDNSEEIIQQSKFLLKSGAPFAPSADGKTILVARHALVKAILADDEFFSSERYNHSGEEITDYKGLLVGLPAGSVERKERLKVLGAAMVLAGPIFGATQIDALAKTLANDVLSDARSLGHFDVVERFGRVVPIQAIEALFGVKGPKDIPPTAFAAHFGRTDPDEKVPADWRGTMPADLDPGLFTMQIWTRLTFLQIFLNHVNGKELREFGSTAGKELLSRIDELFQEAPEPTSIVAPRNLLEAFVKAFGKTPAADTKQHIRLLLAEVTAGTVETVNAALANAVNYIVDNTPKVKRALQDHLKLGDSGASLGDLIGLLTDQDLEKLIFEILRFDPMGPISFRTAVAGAKVDGKAIAPGTDVALAPAAAMRDPTVFPGPEEIDLTRPVEDYLHFGIGLHKCWGRFIALPLLREMFRAIVTLPKLSRAPGKLGKKRQTSPLVIDGLTVRFKPQP